MKRPVKRKGKPNKPNQIGEIALRAAESVSIAVEARKKNTPKHDRIAVIGDLHYSSLPPGRRSGTYTDELEWMIAEAYNIAANSRSLAVACTGDIFHRKASTPHSDVIRFIKFMRPLVEVFGPLLTTTGNHDMVGDDLPASVTSQPIAVLESAGIIKRVDLQTELLLHPGSDNPAMVVSGMPYTSRFDTASLSNEAFWELRLPAVILCHHDIGAGAWARKLYDSGRVGGALVKDSLLAFVNGHLHDAREIVSHHGVMVAQAGSLARTSWSERDLVPSVLIVRFPNGESTPQSRRYDLAHLSADEAFEPDSVESDEEDARMGEFLDLINASGWRDIDAAAMLDDFANEKGADSRVIQEARRWMAESV